MPLFCGAGHKPCQFGRCQHGALFAQVFGGAVGWRGIRTRWSGARETEDSSWKWG